MMAKRRSEVISDVTDFSVTFADNGFIIEYTGNDADENYSHVKKLVMTLDELIAEVKEVINKR